MLRSIGKQSVESVESVLLCLRYCSRRVRGHYVSGLSVHLCLVSTYTLCVRACVRNEEFAVGLTAVDFKFHFH